MKKLTNQERLDLLNFITDEKMRRARVIQIADGGPADDRKFALRKMQYWIDIQTRMNGKPNPASQIEFEIIELEETKKAWTAVAKQSAEDNRRTDSMLMMRKVKFLDIIIEHFTPMAAPVGEQQQLF